MTEKSLFRRSLLAMAAVLLCVPCGVYASGGADSSVSAIVKTTSGMSAEQMIALGDEKRKQGNDADAIAVYEIVANRLRNGMEASEKALCAKARLLAGNVHYDRGSYDLALEEFIAGVKICEDCGDAALGTLGRLYNNIGNVYSTFSDIETSIHYYRKAYPLSRAANDRRTKHKIAVNLTGMYLASGDLKGAKRFFAEAERTKDAGDGVDTYMSGFTRALIERREGKHDASIARFKGLGRFAAAKDLPPEYVCYSYQELFNGYRAVGRTDSALKYLRLCDAHADRNRLRHTFRFTLLHLSDHYNEQGDIAKANEYRMKYISIVDSIYNLRAFDAVKNSLFNYEVGKTTREIQELKTSESEKAQTIRRQRVVLLAALLVILMVCAFLYVIWRQKRKLHTCYWNLYKVNRDFVASQAEMAGRLRQEKENTAAREELPACAAAPPATDGGEPQGRYGASNLTDANRSRIAEAILDVMENTEEFCNPEFSLDSLAQKVGSNRAYVSQAINEVFGKNFSSFVNPYRIHLACARFKDSDGYGHYTLRAIAESVGFKSYTSFVNTFKKVTGLAPSVYQKMAQSEV